MKQKYKFTGFDSWYETGKTYALNIRRTMFGRVVVEVRHGFADEPYILSKRKYRNWEAFREDWTRA